MAIKFACPQCDKQIEVPDQFAGRIGPCPHCRKPVLAPGGDAPKPTSVFESVRFERVKMPKSFVEETAQLLRRRNQDADEHEVGTTTRTSATRRSSQLAKKGRQPGDNNPTVYNLDSVNLAAGPTREQVASACKQVLERDPYFTPHTVESYERGEVLRSSEEENLVLVTDKRLKRRVAMRVLGRAVASPVIERFLREARLLGRLNHPHILTLLELGRNKLGELYMLLPVPDGEELGEAIRRYHSSQALSVPDELIRALAQVASAVAYAHDMGIVHRNLQPGCLRVHDFGAVSIEGWGLAKDMSGAEGDESLVELGLNHELFRGTQVTPAGLVLGTLGYQAPEQARGEDVDGRADVYALGAILTELLTGRPPVSAATETGRLSATLKGEAQAPGDRRGVPPILDKLARSALAFDREERLSSAADFAATLEGYLSQQHAIAALQRRVSLYKVLTVLFLLAAVAAGVAHAFR